MNSSVYDENGNVYYIKGKLSSGGQGVVYTVRDNDSIVIKALPVGDERSDILQDDQTYEEYKKNVRRIIAVGEFENLAIPVAMLKKPFCGYVMQFMNGLQPIANMMATPPYLYKKKSNHSLDNIDDDETYIYTNDCKKEDRVTAKSREEVIFAYNHDGGLGKRIRCLAKLAKILANFEDRNVVHCDLSPNNIFVSKGAENYEVWLIDLDNLSIGSRVKKPIGTPRFMAPEVVKGVKNSIYSDRFSFALIAYRFLMLKDPFEGAAADEYESWDDNESSDDEFDQAVAHGEVAWIWEKNDDSNRSNTGFNPMSLLPSSIFNLFERTLNRDGRSNPEKRPSMWEWYEQLVLAAESVSVREMKYQEPAFRELIKWQGNTKYYREPIEFLTDTEPFSDEENAKIKRYKVNIKNIRPLIDENGIVESIAEGQTTVYWDVNGKTSKYCLSNFDLLDRRPQRYIKDFLVFKRREVLFVKSKEYDVKINDRDYKVIIIENGKVKSVITDLMNSEILITNKGEVIRKISVTVE